MDMINLKINGIAVQSPKGSTVLEAARSVGIEIPTLCFMKEKNEIGACRICMVEVNEGRGFRLVTACVYPCTEGMEVLTNTEKVQKARKTTLELILSTHEKKCLSCVRSTNCELQKLCRDYGVDENAFGGFKPVYELDNSTPHLVRDNNKCILCRRCVAACEEQYVGVIGANNRGIDTCIGQRQCTVTRHQDIAALFEQTDGTADTRFGISHVFAYINSTHRTAFFTQHKYSFEIHFTRFLQMQHAHRLSFNKLILSYRLQIFK